MPGARLFALVLLLAASVATAGCDATPKKSCSPTEAAERITGGDGAVGASTYSKTSVASFEWRDHAKGVCTKDGASALVIFTAEDSTHAMHGDEPCDPLGLQLSAEVTFGKTMGHTVPISLSTARDQNRTGWTGAVQVPLSEAYGSDEKASYDVVLRASFPPKSTPAADAFCAGSAIVDVDLTATFHG